MATVSVMTRAMGMGMGMMWAQLVVPMKMAG
jgi:hypothetical protein